MTVNSKEGSGRFPALVNATYPDQLQMEVQNLFGGSEAFIRVHGNSYDVRDAKKQETREAGVENWRGIPLEWAPLLFVGRIPCPPEDVLKGAQLSVGGEGDLTILTKGTAARAPETFVYQFKVWNGQPWPEQLHWEKRSVSQALAVDFRFDDPEEDTGSPKKWEARSSRGEVKVRWRDREVSH